MPFSIVLYLSYFLSFFDRFLNLIIHFTGNFSGFIRYHKNWKFENNSTEKIQKSLQNMFHFSNVFVEKWILRARKNVDIFEKWIHFLILSNVLLNETALPSGGLLPRTACGGRAIAFKWARRSPSPRKKHLDASAIAVPLPKLRNKQNDSGANSKF